MDDEYLSFEEEDYCYSSEPDDHDQEEGCDEEESGLQHSRKPTSQVITKETLKAAQKDVLVRVMEFLSVKENQARILLIHYQWKIDNLFSVYDDQGKDFLFTCAGLTVFDPCGHFTVRINEGESKRIRCMAHKCNVICDEDVVRRLVSPELAEKFDRILLESYVEDNKMVKWCPSTPHCGNAIQKTVDDDDDEVECSCGHQFCFSCLSESHSPCSCLMWKLWTKKCADESETVNWITVNTKLCPKCSKPVEKRDGCNHMTCICGQCFCWLCGEATGKTHSYRSIAGHSCGRYKDDKAGQMDRAKRDLDRWSEPVIQIKKDSFVFISFRVLHVWGRVVQR
ncbi:PREDICTED: putative E3 ubiquitin-protein ligase ARI4 [Camelina sativa]|uniref:RBR-type E3 ubiquitin transferase n=1 Tax=Camelina sativa TaxID=90675 RepID=A0ABM1RS40_CAMSA|nr:PREDICTED: putative E3 ubiquitin-protein ligase ARI4 [Camelina sativa]